jgi:drug/metabolite transporter (DMT)-like permease
MKTVVSPRARAIAGYALVACAATQWGMWPLILRPAEAIAPMPAALESTVMMVVLTLVSGPFSVRDRVPARATRGQWLGVAWLGFGDAMNVLLFFAAYQTTNVAIAVLTHYLAPIFVALAAPVVLKERPSIRTYVAVALSFSGLVLLLAPWNAEARPTDLLGAALGAGSAVFYAANVLVTKRLTPSFSGSELMFFHGIVSSVILALCVPHEAWSHLNARALTYVAVGSVGPGAFGGLFFVWGLRRVAASHASTLTLLEPLVAVLVAAIAFHEHLAPVALVGGALIVVGAGLVVSKPQT